MLFTNSQKDFEFSSVESVWRENHCLKDSSINLYKRWIQRFMLYCREKNLDEHSQLTLAGVLKFANCYAHSKDIDVNPALCSARSALGSWAHALNILGKSLPPWLEHTKPSQSHSPILKEFFEYEYQHRGSSISTIHKKIKHLESFSSFLRKRKRNLKKFRLQDIDEYVCICAAHYARTTTADICSTIRSFANFLTAKQYVSINIAQSILAPKITKYENLRRVLPWADVQRILQSIDQKSLCGRRDYVLLLMMSMYGLGAGEVIRLTLDDIDWKALTLHVVRPKTGVEFQLPLLPAVAKALVCYLRNGRPAHTTTRHLFVRMKVPHRKLACAVSIRHILHTHAQNAGVNTEHLGTHVLRHTHACRQMEFGTTPQVIGGILGHKDPSSTSAYIRVSIERLRDLALKVPL